MKILASEFALQWRHGDAPAPFISCCLFHINNTSSCWLFHSTFVTGKDTCYVFSPASAISVHCHMTTSPLLKVLRLAWPSSFTADLESKKTPTLYVSVYSHGLGACQVQVQDSGNTGITIQSWPSYQQRNHKTRDRLAGHQWLNCCDFL